MPTLPAQGMREVQDRFTWGEVLDVFDLPLGPKGETIRFVKFHPWRSERHKGADTKLVLFHNDETRHSDVTLDESIVRYIALKNIGLNQHNLVSGIMRALGDQHNIKAVQ